VRGKGEGCMGFCVEGGMDELGWAYCLVKCKIVWLDDIFVCVMVFRHDRHRFCRRLE